MGSDNQTLGTEVCRLLRAWIKFNQSAPGASGPRARKRLFIAIPCSYHVFECCPSPFIYMMAHAQ